MVLLLGRGEAEMRDGLPDVEGVTIGGAKRPGGRSSVGLRRRLELGRLLRERGVAVMKEMGMATEGVGEAEALRAPLLTDALG